MSKRTHPPVTTYTGDDLRAVKSVMESHRDALVAKIQGAAETLTDYRSAVNLRDTVQRLVCTLKALEYLQGSIQTAGEYGRVHSLPFDPFDCGIDLQRQAAT